MPRVSKVLCITTIVSTVGHHEVKKSHIESIFFIL